MILSDGAISKEIKAGRIIVEPMADNALQPSSVDLRLDKSFLVFRNYEMGHIDVKKDLEELEKYLDSPGRIQKWGWVQQAKTLDS